MEQGDEQQAALAKGAGGGLTEIQVERAEDNGDDDVSQPGQDQRKDVLFLEQKLSFHQSPDLTVESDRVRRPPGGATALLFANSNAEILVLVGLLSETLLVLAHLRLQVPGELGLGKGGFQSSRRMRGILDRPAVLVLALVRIRAAGNVVGSGLSGPGKKAEAFEVSPGLGGRAKVDLPALVNDHDLVEQVVNVLGSLV